MTETATLEAAQAGFIRWISRDYCHNENHMSSFWDETVFRAGQPRLTADGLTPVEIIHPLCIVGRICKERRDLCLRQVDFDFDNALHRGVARPYLAGTRRLGRTSWDLTQIFKKSPYKSDL